MRFPTLRNHRWRGLHRVQEGCAFSQAVAEAGVLGYTEPNPREDLRATDLARKVLVLARECGLELEPGQVVVEALIEEPATNVPSLAELLAAQDACWRERVALAQARGERLVVLAEVDARGARVGLRSVGADSAFARLMPGQNLVLVRTQLQDETPLALSGPGAGPEITAAGVLTDMLSAAGQLARRRLSAVGQ